MKKIFVLFCLGAFAFASISCTDDKKDDGKPISGGTMTVNEVTAPVKSALYLVADATSTVESSIMICLFQDEQTEIPKVEPELYFACSIAESLLGKEIDLSQKLTSAGANNLEPVLNIANNAFAYDNTPAGVSIDLKEGADEENLTVTSGKMKMTRSADGKSYKIKMNLLLSNGEKTIVDWSGSPTLLPTDNDNGTITINEETAPVKSALYWVKDETPELQKNIWIYLFKDVKTVVPEEEPDFYFSCAIAESLLNQEIDLSQKLTSAGSTSPEPEIKIGNNAFYYVNNPAVLKVNSLVGSGEAATTVSSGKMLVARGTDGKSYKIKLNLVLSNGEKAVVDWSGDPTLVAGSSELL